MIEREKIQHLVEGILTEDMFIVGISVDSGNAIAVSVDSDNGISIDTCAQISRHLEMNLDRNEEDFSLEVSSPGLTQPLKVLRQYYKNIGRNVEVVDRNGRKYEGILKSVNSEGFELQTAAKRNVNGPGEPDTSPLMFSFGQIKTVKLIISFK